MKKLLCNSIVAALSALLTAPLAAATVVTGDGLSFSIENGRAIFTGISRDFTASLTDLEIPATVTSDGRDYNVTDLAANCCDNNTILRSVKLGENVRNVGDYAFRNCTSLTSITFNDGLETIGEDGFYKAALQSLDLPLTLNSIGDLAFYGCPVTTVEIPAGLTKLGVGVFATCRSITEFKVAEGNVNFAATDGVLFDADKTILYAYPIGKVVTSYEVPSTVKTIAPYSVRNASFLNNITFNEGLDSIGSSAFVQGRLTEVNLPSSVRAIGFQAFSAMPTVTAYTVAEGNQYYKAVDKHLLTADGKRLLFGAGSVTDVVIPEGVEEVSGYSFYTFSGVKSLKLASTTKTVGTLAFYSNASLNSVDFGTALDSIGEGAFRRCVAIPAVNLPATVRTIGRTAFAESTGFHEVTLNEGVKFLGELAFTRCYGLKKVKLPSTIKAMDYGAFVYCSMLEEVELADGLTLIGDGAFQECLQLSKVNFPSSLQKIGDFAFTSAGMEEISLNDGLESVGAAAFEFCKFKSLRLPDTLTKIGQFGFAWNSALLEVIGGSSLEELDDYAFAGCTSLGSFTFNSDVRTIGEGAFGSCSKLPSLKLPSSVEFVGAGCFAEDTSLKEIHMLGTTPPETGGPLYSDVFDGYRMATLEVPMQSVSAYQNDAEWGKFLYIEGVDSGVESAAVEDVSVVAVYDLNGVNVGTQAKGICLQRMSDGTVRKVIVK